MRKFLVTGFIGCLVLLTATDLAQAQRGRGGWGGGGYNSGWGGGGSYGPSFSIGFGRGGYGYGYPYGYGYGNYGYNRPYYGNWSSGYPSYGYSYSQPYYEGYSASYPVIPGAPATYSNADQSYQTGYNEVDNNRVWLQVRVPDANARVWIDDHATQQTGMDRQFISPAVERGKKYSYKVKATWVENGKEVSREKQVSVQAGQPNFVNFTNESGQVQTNQPAQEGQPQQPVNTDGTQPRFQGNQPVAPANPTPSNVPGTPGRVIPPDDATNQPDARSSVPPTPNAPATRTPSGR